MRPWKCYLYLSVLYTFSWLVVTVEYGIWFGNQTLQLRKRNNCYIYWIKSANSNEHVHILKTDKKMNLYILWHMYVYFRMMITNSLQFFWGSVFFNRKHHMPPTAGTALICIKTYTCRSGRIQAICIKTYTCRSGRIQAIGRPVEIINKIRESRD